MGPLALSLFAKAVSIEYRLLTQFWVEENIEILSVYSIPMLYVYTRKSHANCVTNIECSWYSNNNGGGKGTHNKHGLANDLFYDCGIINCALKSAELL